MGPASRPRGSECHCPVRWRQPQEGSRGQACVGSRSRSQDCRRCRVGSADRHPNTHEQHLLRAQHSPTRCWECTEGPRPRVTPKEQFSLLYSELIALCKHALAGVCLGGGKPAEEPRGGEGGKHPPNPGGWQAVGGTGHVKAASLHERACDRCVCVSGSRARPFRGRPTASERVWLGGTSLEPCPLATRFGRRIFMTLGSSFLTSKRHPKNCPQPCCVRECDLTGGIWFRWGHF